MATPGGELLEALAGLGTPRVLVVGDLMLDVYVFGRVERISPEAPIQILNVERDEERPGGCGSVVAMLRRLEAEVEVVSLVGADEAGERLMVALQALGAGTGGIVRAEDGRPTTRKTRLIAHEQQVLRVDREVARPVGEAAEAALLAAARERLEAADIVLVSDYGKGVVTPGLLRPLLALARARGRELILDPRKGRAQELYRGVTAITPNRSEAAEASGIEPRDRASWERAARVLVERLELEGGVLLTLDRDGIFWQPRDGEPVHVPTRPRAVYDVTGAGDMVLSTVGLCRAAGLSWPVAAELANIAAGIEIERLGVATVSREEIAQEIRARGDADARKVIDLESFVRGPLRELRRRGKRVVFTNGVFDLLHVGHVKTLQFARAQGDCLVVGVNSDASVRAIKGPDRPIVGQEDRARMLAALAAVDYVIVFDEPTPLALIEAIVPEVLVKAADYEGRPVVGRAVVERAGGRVVLAPLVQGVSTTELLERAQRRQAGEGEATAASGGEGGAAPPGRAARLEAERLYAAVEGQACGRAAAEAGGAEGAGASALAEGAGT
ncbi:MAG: bifunctional protein HldE [Planctomycetota bacterium]|nr:MAG: bifunctional protein HldE [Planctomycetota bacterium]